MGYREFLRNAFVKGTGAGSTTDPFIPMVSLADTSGVDLSTTLFTSSFFLRSLATTNVNVVKASPGRLAGLTAANFGATAAYLKLFDKASAPTLGTDWPFHILLIGATAQSVLNPFVGGGGLKLNNGLAIAITRSIGGLASDAIGADEVLLAIQYS